MAEEDWQPLRDLGFNDEGVLEVAHIVGIFNYLTAWRTASACSSIRALTNRSVTER